MRLKLLLTAALLIAPAAYAQTDRSGGTQAFVNMCVGNAGAHVTTPEPTCACGAGLISGRMDDRQFEIMRQLAPYAGDQPRMNAAVQQMIREGYAAQEIQTVGQMLIDLGPDIQRTCGILER